MTVRTVAVLAIAAAMLGACGRKADPQPYGLVRPRPIGSLAGRVVPEGVRLAWLRPGDYVSGKRMDDLGGFLVFRGRPGEESEELADIPVDDRERFQREKTFEYLDRNVKPGETWYYRIVSYTTDRYYSEPSNQVTVEVAKP